MTPEASAIIIARKLEEYLSNNESVKSFFDDFTEATVNWLRPLFLIDDEPNEMIKALSDDPGNQEMLNKVVESLLTKHNSSTDSTLIEAGKEIRAANPKKHYEGMVINGKNVVIGSTFTGPVNFN